MSPEDDYCFNLVRQVDRDRYLAALFAPEDKRADLLALYAFNAEITRVRDIVTEPHLGEIRLQWWQDTLDAIYHGDAQPDLKTDAHFRNFVRPGRRVNTNVVLRPPTG